jgi:hypothetical protein
MSPDFVMAKLKRTVAPPFASLPVIRTDVALLTAALAREIKVFAAGGSPRLVGVGETAALAEAAGVDAAGFDDPLDPQPTTETNAATANT